MQHSGAQDVSGTRSRFTEGGGYDSDTEIGASLTNMCPQAKCNVHFITKHLSKELALAVP